MNELQVFKNDMFCNIRAIIINNDPWFVGSDIAGALGYADKSSAVKRHVDEDDIYPELYTSNAGHDVLLINESGVYALIFNSHQKRAKDFKHWVTSDVLPALRKTGHYSLRNDATMQQNLDENNDAKIADILNNSSAKIQNIVLDVVDLTGYKLDYHILPESLKKSKRHGGRYPADSELTKKLKELWKYRIEIIMEIQKRSGISYALMYDASRKTANLHPDLAEELKNIIFEIETEEEAKKKKLLEPSLEYLEQSNSDEE